VQICFSGVNSLGVFRDYAKRILSHSKNTPKLFNRLQKMRQNFLSAHRDYGDFRVVFCTKTTQNMLKVFNIFEEYVKSISVQMENMPNESCIVLIIRQEA
jgi:hypothetical protein